MQFATVSTPAGKDVAYLRLANFADNAVKSVEGALQKVRTHVLAHHADVRA